MTPSEIRLYRAFTVDCVEYSGLEYTNCSTSLYNPGITLDSAFTCIVVTDTLIEKSRNQMQYIAELLPSISSS